MIRFMTLRERINKALDEFNASDIKPLSGLGSDARELLPLVLAEMERLEAEVTEVKRLDDIRFDVVQKQLRTIDGLEADLARVTAERDAAKVVYYRRGVEAVIAIATVYASDAESADEIEVRARALLAPEPSTGVHPEYRRGVEAAINTATGAGYIDCAIRIGNELLAPEPAKAEPLAILNIGEFSVSLDLGSTKSTATDVVSRINRRLMLHEEESIDMADAELLRDARALLVTIAPPELQCDYCLALACTCPTHGARR